jgi:hypothetical protein
LCSTVSRSSLPEIEENFRLKSMYTLVLCEVRIYSSLKSLKMHLQDVAQDRRLAAGWRNAIWVASPRRKISHEQKFSRTSNMRVD